MAFLKTITRLLNLKKTLLNKNQKRKIKMGGELINNRVITSIYPKVGQKKQIIFNKRNFRVIINLSPKIIITRPPKT